MSIVQRTAHGYDLCDQLGESIGDLGSVIQSFAKGLSGWSQTWRAKIAKNGECGLSVNAAHLRLIETVEAMKIAHSSVADDLGTNVVEQLKTWQKGHYRRSVMGKIKEATEVEADFATSQAPWNKLMKRQEKTKLKYYDLSKKVINTKHQESVARHDTSKSPDELEDLRNKIGRLETDQVEAEENYRQSVFKLEAHQQEYIANMKKNYEKADAIETQRLNFFRSLMEKSRAALAKLADGQRHAAIAEALTTFETSISNIWVDEDLMSFRTEFGDEIPFQHPPFEEYTETLHQVLRGQKLSKKLSSNYVGGGGGRRSLSSLNPFKSTTSTIPTSIEDDDIEGFSGERIATIRFLSRESPRSFKPSVDANNNTNDDAEDDHNDDAEDDHNDDDHNDDDHNDDDRNSDGNLGKIESNSTAVAAPPMRKTVSFQNVVEELSQRQKTEPIREIARAKQVVTVSPNPRRSEDNRGICETTEPSLHVSSSTEVRTIPFESAVVDSAAAVFDSAAAVVDSATAFFDSAAANVNPVSDDANLVAADVNSVAIDVNLATVDDVASPDGVAIINDVDVAASDVSTAAVSEEAARLDIPKVFVDATGCDESASSSTSSSSVVKPPSVERLPSGDSPPKGNVSDVIPAVPPVPQVEAMRDIRNQVRSARLKPAVNLVKPAKPALKPRSTRLSESEATVSASLQTAPALETDGNENVLSPYLVAEDSRESESDATATDPRVLSRCEEEGYESDESVTEPELTLAGGGSVLGGHISSFDAELTLPGDGHEPIVVSTELRGNNHLETASISPLPLLMPRDQVETSLVSSLVSAFDGFGHSRGD